MQPPQLTGAVPCWPSWAVSLRAYLQPLVPITVRLTCTVSFLSAAHHLLLQVLAGLDDFDQGSISRNKGARVGFLAQEPALPPGTTVLEVGVPRAGGTAWSGQQ